MLFFITIIIIIIIVIINKKIDYSKGVLYILKTRTRISHDFKVGPLGKPITFRFNYGSSFRVNCPYSRRTEFYVMTSDC